jgi:AcrR family transcriptional regulator
VLAHVKDDTMTVAPATTASPRQSPGSRRDRTRAATIEEIKSTARALLVEQGPSGPTFRAVARVMGIAVSGLYRYFPSHEDLVAALVVDAQERLADHLVAARAPTAVAGSDDAAARLTRVCMAFRAWAADNRQEFALVFTTAPAPAHGDGAPPLSRYATVFAESFFELWATRPFAVPDPGSLPPLLVEQLQTYSAALRAIGAECLPLGAVYVFLRCWVQLFGLVALDTHGHLAFCLTDAEPFFQAGLEELAQVLGLGGPTGHQGLDDNGDRA